LRPGEAEEVPGGHGTVAPEPSGQYPPTLQTPPAVAWLTAVGVLLPKTQ